MIKHAWSLICRHTVIDKETNNMSIDDVFESITVDANNIASTVLPLRHNIPVDYEIVSMWFKDTKDESENLEIEISVKDPQDNKIKTFDYKANFPVGLKHLRTRLRVQGFTASSSGTYIFEVAYKLATAKKRNVVAELPIEVIINGLTDEWKND